CRASIHTDCTISAAICNRLIRYEWQVCDYFTKVNEGTKLFRNNRCVLSTKTNPCSFCDCSVGKFSSIDHHLRICLGNFLLNKFDKLFQPVAKYNMVVYTPRCSCKDSSSFFSCTADLIFNSARVSNCDRDDRLGFW